jgi:hypothetical protein
VTDEGTDDDRVSVRPLQRSDAAEIAAMNTRNRADVERVSPRQPASAFTAAGQTERIEKILKQCQLGTRAYWTIRDSSAVTERIASPNMNSFERLLLNALAGAGDRRPGSHRITIG